MGKKITLLIVTLAFFFLVGLWNIYYRSISISTDALELVGGWKSVMGGIDAEIDFSIENGKKVFNSYSGEQDGVPSHPMLSNCYWDYKQNKLFIYCPNNPVFNMTFNSVVISDTKLELTNTDDPSLDGTYERIILKNSSNLLHWAAAPLR